MLKMAVWQVLFLVLFLCGGILCDNKTLTTPEPNTPSTSSSLETLSSTSSQRDIDTSSITTPSTPQPDTPTPSSPTPSTSTPSTPQPDTPTPSSPTPSTSTPNTTQPHTSTPNTTQPHTPTPNTTQPHTPTPNTTQPDTPTTGSPTPSKSSSNSTNANSGSPTHSSSAAPTKPLPALYISETNILLVSQMKTTLFVELQGPAGVDVSQLMVTVTDAYTENLLVTKKLTSVLDKSGRLVLELGTQEDWTTKHSEVKSVLIAVSTEHAVSEGKVINQGILDFVVYATESSSHWDSSGLKEGFYVQDKNQLIIVDKKALDVDKAMTFSSCSTAERSNAGLALTLQTQGQGNKCDLIKKQTFEMKLTLQGETCNVAKQDQSFNSTLPVVLIHKINDMRQCGLTWHMVRDMTFLRSCKDPQTFEVAARFTVASAFSEQMTIVQDAYKSLLHEQKPFPIGQGRYSVSECAGTCFPVPPTNNDDGKVKVTIAVVVSCIGVFLLVLLFVVLYMRGKRKGILQFRMTRLDEDDDDLIGDMDDFVGSQGPTFSSFR